MDLHLKQLRNFLIVYEEGSIGRAAVRCNSTQPGLSAQIAMLETELNVKLFHRHARGIHPTAAGQQLYVRGRRLLEDANATLREIQSLSGSVSGVISAGISPALAKAILPRVLARCVQEYPDVELRVSEDYSAILISLLENRLLDFAIVAHIPTHPTIKFEHIYQDVFVAVSSARSGIPDSKPIQLNALPYRKLAIPSVRHGVQSVLDVPLRTREIVPERIIEINSVFGVLEFVAESDWIALVPETSILYGLDTKRLRVHPIAGNEIRMDYYVAHLATEPLSAASNAFIAIVNGELVRVREDSDARRLRHPMNDKSNNRDVRKGAAKRSRK